MSSEQQSAATTSPEALWASLRELVEPISLQKHLAPFMRYPPSNSATKAAAAAAAAGAETTVQEYPAPRVQVAEDIDSFFDSYSLIQRVDVVNEDVLPFVPYVQPLSLRQFQLIEYGMLLSSTERTILALHQFVPPVERRVRGGSSAIRNDHHGVDIKHNVPSRALLPGEELETEEEYVSGRFEEGCNSDLAGRERIYHAYLLRIAEDSRDGSAMIVPEFRLTFVNRGKDSTHLGASFVCTGCYASANKYFDIHSDLREQRDFYTQLPYYSRFTADRFEPLKHREELFNTWKRLTGGSILSDGTAHPQIGEEQAPVCGYAVEDYTIEEELKEATRQPSEERKQMEDEADRDSIARRTISPVRANRNNNNNKLVNKSGNSAAVDGVTTYLKSVDISGTARHMTDHSVVFDTDICDAVAVTAGAVPIPEVRPNSTGDFIVRRCTYANDRMAQRVLIQERRRGPVWRDHWEGMCKSLGLTDDFTLDNEGRVSAARVVLRDTRGVGENVLEDGEISAYVPSDAECALRAVYNDEAEEQLRLWITKGLISCESYGIHLALLPIDVDMILSRCIGLLFDNDGGIQRKNDEESQPSTDVTELEKERARRRILRIVVDAVEEFVQYSGTVWRVVLYMNSTPSNNAPSARLAAGGEPTLLDDLREVSDYSIARGLLAQIQARKSAQEVQEAGGVPRPSTGSRPATSNNQVVSTVYNKDELRTPRTIRGKFGTDPRLGVTSPLRQIRPEVISSVTMIPAVTESPARVREGKGHSITTRSLVSQQGDGFNSLTTSAADDSGSPRRLAEFGMRSEEVKSAALHGLYLDESSQRELFNRMDVDHSGYVTLKEIKDVLLKKTHKYDKTVLTSRGTIAGRAVHESSFSAGNVLSPIDDCGVPLDEKHIDQFLSRKCHRYGNKMTFDEFSVMLLELARR